ncbi:MAG: beta-ketoacyl-ACP synthase [Pseudomonadales bacterium]
MIHVQAFTLCSALGAGMGATRQALAANRSGLMPANWPDCDVPCYLGAVNLPEEVVVPDAFACRNNRLIELALAQDSFLSALDAVRSTVPSHRIGVVMGTSTSGIDRTEAAYRHLTEGDHLPAGFLQPRTHNPHSPGDYVAHRLGIHGPCLTVSAACASSAKVFAVAQRWLTQELVDAVVVGGADALCLSVIYGFHSLQLVSPAPCTPFAPDRQGISLGEAAGFVLLTREPAPVQLLGAGESCDAYHMSSAPPDGLGDRLCMERALAQAGMTMADIDYVNLHGTGTRANDETEALVCGEMGAPRTVFSATKGFTGHALGAAGIVEAVLVIDALLTGLVPGTCNTRRHEAPFDLLLESREQSLRTAMSNSFGFGGNNCSLVFARA